MDAEGGLYQGVLKLIRAYLESGVMVRWRRRYAARWALVAVAVQYHVDRPGSGTGCVDPD
jgi:hypothetical protein